MLGPEEVSAKRATELEEERTKGGAPRGGAEEGAGAWGARAGLTPGGIVGETAGRIVEAGAGGTPRSGSEEKGGALGRTFEEGAA